MKDLVIAYYDFDEITCEISYVKLVNLLDDSIILVKNEQDFNKYRDRILYSDTELIVRSYSYFMKVVSADYVSLNDLNKALESFIVVAEYENAIKVLELKSDKVYEYSLYSFLTVFNNDYKSFDYAYALYGELLNIFSNAKTVKISEKLDVYIDNLSFPYLTIYNCGTGFLLCEKARYLENQGLVVFPKELKYLPYIDLNNFTFRDKVNVGTIVFSKNTRYIDLYKLCLCFNFKTLIVNRNTYIWCGISNPKFSFDIVYTD